MARWIPPRLDVALAVGMAATGAILAVVAGTPPAPGLPLLIVPVAWRRQAPTIVAVLAAVGLLGVVGWPVPPGLILLVVAATVVVAYSVAVHARAPGLGLVALTAGLVPIAVWSPQLPIPAWLGPYSVLAAAAAAGLAVRRRSRSAAAERTAALAAERTRIAREMHDVVTHRISVMVLQAGAARSILPGRPERAIEALRLVEAGGREALDELRRLLGLLTTTADTSGLAPPPGLAGLPDLVSGAGLPVRLTIVGEPRRLPAGLELAAYRIVQEALTNALRHSARTGTAVTVTYGPDLDIDIVDDTPVPHGKARSNGFGLAGMAERAAMYGGSVTAGPHPDGRWRVHAQLPIPDVAT